MSKPNSHITLDKSQFEVLFKTHFQHLCNFALQFVEDIDTAQGIVQKVFITLWEKRNTLDPNKSLKAYLFTSVRNRCLNHIRDQKKYRSTVLDLECAEFEVVSEEDQFAADDLKEKIAAALAELPEKCRKVFEMSRFQNMKYKEIAEELEISQKTVEAHMSKAMKSLRNSLKDFMPIAMIIYQLAFIN